MKFGRTAAILVATMLGALASGIGTAGATGTGTQWYRDPSGDWTHGPMVDITQWGVTHGNGRTVATVLVDNYIAPHEIDGGEEYLEVGFGDQVAASFRDGGTTVTGCAGAFASADDAHSIYRIDVPSNSAPSVGALKVTTSASKTVCPDTYRGPVCGPSPGLDEAGPDIATSGYRMVTATGDVHSFGNGDDFGGVRPSTFLGVVDIEPSPADSGYYLLQGNGEVSARGYVVHFGNAVLAPDERATAISATPSGDGYWIFTDKGRAITFGDAQHFGDMSGVALQGPVLDAIPTPSGNGYYMVGSDGGIFSFGDAVFFGSMGGQPLNAPVMSLVPDPDGSGYWLVALDGGVFAFDAGFMGSMGGVTLNKPITGMVPFGNGYLMVGEDGGIFNFSDKPFLGSLGSNPPDSPVVSVAVA